MKKFLPKTTKSSLTTLPLTLLISCSTSTKNTTHPYTSFENYTDPLASNFIQSDDRFKSCLWNHQWQCEFTNSPKEKEGYFETIHNLENGSRDRIKACGLNGTIDQRIKDCATSNKKLSHFESQKLKITWKLVSVIKANQQYEVWIDTATNLLWSDRTDKKYNWYRATGYAKNKDQSILETQFIAEPGYRDNETPYKVGIALQPKNPISVCHDHKELTKVTPYQYKQSDEAHDSNERYAFKGYLENERVQWKVPSRIDWMIAETHGIRKVLPRIDYKMWSTTSGSDYRNSVWLYDGKFGVFDGSDRQISQYVRCIGKRNDIQ
ncbi:hypothetical protein HBN50_13630 [Halobacteriovorax sp. GB3]|uniref:hypothetical protein n=1 Tax=Halobacteriovorax sp. GB3 TaxID=2719615 RepID=UPI0023627E27|nr:hypothetical protein [Halobacteriovorax sp. GB3]MDD0854148.1 hypothetical protein [Halobacteriovorax sp. GB3]